MPRKLKPSLGFGTTDLTCAIDNLTEVDQSGGHSTFAGIQPCTMRPHNAGRRILYHTLARTSHG